MKQFKQVIICLVTQVLAFCALGQVNGVSKESQDANRLQTASYSIKYDTSFSSIINNLQPLASPLKQITINQILRKQRQSMFAAFKLLKPVQVLRPRLDLLSASITENISSIPVIVKDSSEVFITNKITADFSFSILDKYVFRGYGMYQNSIAGKIPNFFDFHIGYTGLDPRKSKGITPETLMELFRKNNFFDQALDSLKLHLSDLNVLLSNKAFVHELLLAKEIASNYRVDHSFTFVDSASVVQADSIINLYNEYERHLQELSNSKDSILLFRDKFLSKLKLGENWFKDFTATIDDSLTTLLADQRLKGDAKYKDVTRSNIGLSRLAIGRVSPIQSELTLKNTSLRGIDLEYQTKKLVIALAGGLVDFRLNNLISSRKLEHPMPYSVVLYGGYKVSDKITAGIRYFKGKKDNYSSGIRKIDVDGAAFEIKYFSKDKYIKAEIAKSRLMHPDRSRTTSDSLVTKTRDLDDHREYLAFALKSSLNFPVTKTTFSGAIAIQGSKYVAFNNFTANIQSKVFEARLHQQLFKGTVKVSGSIRNTDLTPSLEGVLIQNKVLLKSLNVILNKRNLPVVSVGYNPVKQSYLNDSVLQQMFHHAFSLSSSYSYRVGERRANSSMLINKYGSREASGLSTSFDNSLNIIVDNSLDFLDYNLQLNVSYTKSPNILFIVSKGACNFNMKNSLTLNTSFTANQFGQTSKLGGGLALQKTTEKVSLSLEYMCSYFPSLSGSKLLQYNFGNLHLRYDLLKRR